MEVRPIFPFSRAESASSSLSRSSATALSALPLHTNSTDAPNTFLLPLIRLSSTIEKQVIADARRVASEPEDSSYIPSDPREFASRIFHTCYMGTENSSDETRQRAKDLADAIGRYVLSPVISLPLP
jgi:hypothetical protein